MNLMENSNIRGGPPVCEPGAPRGWVFPLSEQEQHWPEFYRTMMYAFVMIYIFVGVNLVSEKFMGAIHRITSQRIRVKDKSSGRVFTQMRWNRTIGNLTLMGLGSSAPEILLSCVEMIRNEFHSGLLGPSTIVGSAAFNLFVIIAICIVVVPSSTKKKVKESEVFWVTALFSLACYGWMLFCIMWSSPNVIQIWEALMTLFLFPLLLTMSYIVDRKFLEANMVVKTVPCSDLVYFDSREPAASNIGKQTDEDNHSNHSDENAQTQEWDLAIWCLITFGKDSMTLVGKPEEQIIKLPVIRKDHRKKSQRDIEISRVSCSYRTERLTAVPDHDYVEQEGEVHFGPDGQAEIELTLLPVASWRHSVEFQVILEQACTGAAFSPEDDGAGRAAILTIKIEEAKVDEAMDEDDGYERMRRKVMRWLDLIFDLQSLKQAKSFVYLDLRDALWQIWTDHSEPRTVLDYVLYVVNMPWRFFFGILVPPYEYAGGWPCFFVCIGHFVMLTAILLEVGELFGCCAGIKDSITAITFVSVGTSLPDLFASKTAAVREEFADAAVINVTGSNSLNVLLGIGFPWSIASIYWRITGPTPQWTALYSEIAKDYKEDGQAVLVVHAGDLGFSVLVFTIAALLSLTIIRIRRQKVGGELGGPFLSKALSAAFLIFLWICYILLSIWKMVFDFEDFGNQASQFLTVPNFVTGFSATVVLAFMVVAAGDIWSGDWWRYSN